MSILPTQGRIQLQVPMNAHLQTLSAWDPCALADPRAGQDGVPVASFATALALAVVGLAAASYAMERYEP